MANRRHMKPYSIWLPEFQVTSGGIRVLWGLFGALLAKGMIIQPNVQYQEDFIAIYPEIVNGNPLHGSTIVRYLLNSPGVMSMNGLPSPTSFDKTDKLWYFSRLFGKSEEDNYLFLPIINTHLFKDQGKKRTKKAVLFGKGQDMNKHPKDCIVIDREIAQDQQVLADLLNVCQVVYIYDPVTAFSEVARLCGCRVVIFPSTYTKEEFSVYEPGLEGISWGKDEGVKLDVEKFREHYLDMKDEFSWRLDEFIESTQE